MANKVYDYVTQRILEELEKGVIPWKKPWFTTKVNYVSRRPYHGINLLLLPEPGEYLTFNQVNKLGGKIKKGSNSHMVTFFKILEKEERNDKGELETKTKKIPLLRYYRVFHLDDVEGIDSKLEEPEGIDTDQKAEEIINNYQNKPKIEIKKSDRAYYSPVKDRVVCPDKKQYKIKEQYYGTLFHELVHSTGHKRRLNRFDTENLAAFGSKTYSFEELIAEIGSSMLLSKSGMDLNKTVKNSASYIKGWSEKLKNNRTMIVQAAGKAQKAAEHITGE